MKFSYLDHHINFSVMPIAPFKLERYFAKYEFSSKYLLSSSDCESLALQEVLEMADPECQALWSQLKLSYTESQGHPLLRDEIANLYNTISSEQVLTLVPEEGIFIAMQVLLESGDHVVTTFPGYQSLYEIALSKGCHVDKWMPAEEGSFLVEDLEAMVRPETKMIVINFPHNPTGEHISPNELDRIITLAKANDCILFSDEMYRLLEYHPDDQLPSASDIYDKAISLFGLSKSFALPGLRMGWLTTQQEEWLSAFKSYKDYTTICAPAPTEILSIIALRNRDRIIQRNLSIIEGNLKLLNELTLRHPDLISWKQPVAGPLAFPELHLRESVMDFCTRLAEEKSVMLLPAEVYDYPKSSVRLGLGRNITEGLHLFESFLTAKK